MKKMSLVLCLVISIVVVTGFYSEKMHSDIKGSLIRLHIIANSDSKEDQDLKYRIRDKLIQNYSEIPADGLEQAQQNLVDQLPSIEQMVNAWLEEEQVPYRAKAVMGKDYFPTKQYGNLKLPAGEYEAVKVILGEGKGQNWWCVMFPPICFVDGTTGFIDDDSEAYLKENLSEEEFKLITDDSAPVEIRFKIVELWQKWTNKKDVKK